MNLILDSLQANIQWMCFRFTCNSSHAVFHCGNLRVLKLCCGEICQHILKAFSREKFREKTILKHEIKPNSQNIDLTEPRNGLSHFPAKIYVQKRFF